jgi:hypothetical protein
MSLMQNSCQDGEAVVPPILLMAMWEGPRPRGPFIGEFCEEALMINDFGVGIGIAFDSDSEADADWVATPP